MPHQDFWLDWRLTASVAQLRVLLPQLTESYGYAVAERTLAATGDGWATFDLRLSGGPRESFGIARAQDEAAGGTQLFLAPGPWRDSAGLGELNRCALAIYCGLLATAALAPPAPLEPPDRPLR